MACIQLRLSVVTAHSSLEIGECLHEPLRRSFRMLRMDHHSLAQQAILNISVKEMNDIIGENGLVPSLLVFGITPRFHIIGT